MPFQNSNFGGNSNNQQQQDGEKKKTNYRLGRFFGSDAILEVTVWLSNSAVNTILQIKSAVGKDPSTGQNVYENKSPMEVPRLFLKPDQLRLFTDYIKTHDSIDWSPSDNSHITITGINNGDIKITIAEKKHPQPRTITFPAIPVSNGNVQNGNWKNILKILDVALDRALLIKLNPDAFSDANPTATDDLPI